MAEASLDVPLREHAFLNKSFTKLHVEPTGRSAALGNNKTLLVYHFEQDQHDDTPAKRHTVYRYKDEAKQLFAVRFNPHHSCRTLLASAKGQVVHVWDLEQKEVAATSATGVTTLRPPTAANVHDLCWHRFNENLLAAGDFLWDMRTRDSVQEWRVPGGEASRLLTKQVSFNRKNGYLLASARLNQVYIWDTRKEQKPIDTIPVSLPAEPVTSLDWSSKSEYDLLTSGGENFSLWKVDSAKAKELAPRGSTPPKRKGTSVLVKKRTWLQPVHKVLFAPFGQAAITVSRGYFEGKEELQTIKMWSIPSSDLQLVATFRAGVHPIVGVSWRSTGDGSYQVASLDDDDHLRLHSVDKLDFARPGVDLPAGDSSGARDYGSTAGSESLETSTAPKMPVLRNEILPVVWRFSELQSTAAPSTVVAETTSDSSLRELVQAEMIAKRGGFGSVTSVHLNAAHKYLSFVMTARPLGTGGHSQPRAAEATKVPGPTRAQQVATVRLRVTARAHPGHRSRDAHTVVELASEGKPPHHAPLDPSTAMSKDVDPLDETTVKRMQAAVEDVMRQTPKPGKSLVEACLVRVRRDLDDCVRDAASQAAESPPGEELTSQRVGLQCDDSAESSVPKMLASTGIPRIISDDEGIPCPRRFGATFAANGSLVVFSSSAEVVRAGRKRADTNGEQVYTYPRTYGCLNKCLKAGRQLDNEEESPGDGVRQSHLDDNHSWFRSAWGDGADGGSGNEDDGTYDLDRGSVEEALVEEDREALNSDVITDSTWLPISHPDHSLGAGLGPPSEDDGEEKESDDGGAETDVEGELPWTPKFNKTFLVDCTGFLPGSPVFAAFYQLGPIRQLAAHGQHVAANFSVVDGERDERNFGLLAPEMKRGYSGTGSDTSASSGGLSRRNSLVASSGMPPPLSVPQRGFSSAQENAARSSSFMRRTSIDGGQFIPPVLTKSWASTPNFKVFPGKSGASSSRIGWAAPSESGRSIIAGSPARSELARGIKISSPQLHSQASELEDVAELPLDDSGMNITPPRSMGGLAGDSGTLSPGAAPAMKPSAHGYVRTRQRLGKRRQYQQYPRSPGSSGGPSPPLDTPRLLPGALTPASPIDTSTSPPMSDIGMDIGQISAPAGQTGANAAGQGTVSRSSSFSTGSGGGFGELAGDRVLVAQLGLSGRGRHSSIDSPAAFDAAGVGVRSGADLVSNPGTGINIDEGSAEDTVGQLSRHNARVAAVRNCGELASVWAMLSEASDRGAPRKTHGFSGLGKLVDARRLPRWGTSSVRLTSKILAHHELRADPQTLASIVSVVGSGSGLLQGEDRVALHDRYMDCYAERCCQWGAQGERAVVIGHRAEAHDPVHTAGDYTAKPLNCVVCNTLVHGRRLQCHRCGHGGHSKHVAAWFEFEAECRHEACECLCWKNSLWEHAG